MSQSYDALGDTVSRTFPDGDTATYSYNEAGWLGSIPGYITSITYNARGQQTRLQYANGVTSTSGYDPMNFRVTNRSTTGASGALQDLGYTYDPTRSEEHTSELQSPCNLVCRLLLEKKKNSERASIYV